nr:pollen-specific leucine-rich repeat extensin-like protein 1 [Arachis hypogaea]
MAFAGHISNATGPLLGTTLGYHRRSSRPSPDTRVPCLVACRVRHLTGDDILADPRATAPSTDILPAAPGHRDEIQLPWDAPDRRRRTRRQPRDDVRRPARQARGQHARRDSWDPKHGQPFDALFADHEADVATRLIPGTSIPSHHPIIRATGDAIDDLVSRYRHRRDDTDIFGTSSSVSTQHGSAPPGCYQTPPPPSHQSGSTPSPYYQTPSLPPQPPLFDSSWPSPPTPPPMIVAAPLPPIHQRPPLTSSQTVVRPRSYRPPRVSRPHGCENGHHLDPAVGRR